MEMPDRVRPYANTLDSGSLTPVNEMNGVITHSGKRLLANAVLKQIERVMEEIMRGSNGIK